MHTEIHKDTDYDFGFSLVASDQLTPIEEYTAVNDKIQGILDMIMPLLDNLMADPQKEFIHWPNRVEKIQKFKEKLERYANHD